MLSDLDSDDLEDIESRLYSQVFHSNVEESPTIPQEVQTETGYKRPRYFQENPFNQNRFTNFTPAFVPLENSSITQDVLSKGIKRKLAKQAKQQELLRIKRAANEDAELFRNLSREERKKVIKYQKRQRYMERKRERKKAEKEERLIDDYNREINWQNMMKSVNEPVILISDEEVCNVISSDDENNVKIEIDDYYADDVVLVEPDIIEPEIINLDPISPNELMKPPSDIGRKTIEIVKERKENSSTPESNDFLDTPSELSVNYEKVFLKPKSLAEAFETESSCSAISDNSTPLKAVVFNEIAFDTPTKNLFHESNLESFGDFITPKRQKNPKSIPTLLTPNEEFVQTKANKILAKSASDSSSESEFDDDSSKVGLISKKLPNLTPFDDEVVVNNSSDDEEGKSKKKSIKKKKKLEKKKTELDESPKKKLKEKRKKSCSDEEDLVKKKKKNDETNSKKKKRSITDSPGSSKSDDVEIVKKKKRSRSSSATNMSDETSWNEEKLTENVSAIEPSTLGNPLEITVESVEAKVDTENKEKSWNEEPLDLNSDSNDVVIVYDQKEDFETIDITDDAVVLPKSEVEIDLSSSSDESSDYRFSVLDNEIEQDISLANLSTTDMPLMTTVDKSGVSFNDFWTEDMKTFYGTWGLEFDTKTIQKSLTDDPKKWRILERDRLHIKTQTPRGPYCRQCRTVGHTRYNCRNMEGPPKCSLCGNRGHREARCPNKMCTRCGSQDGFSSVYCRNCFNWRHNTCSICNMQGHIEKFCPDLWRRYHLTTKPGPIVQGDGMLKPPDQQWCSGCSKSGHLEYMCNYYGREHPPVLPYVVNYVDNIRRNNNSPKMKKQADKTKLDSIKEVLSLEPTTSNNKSALPSLARCYILNNLEVILFKKSDIGLNILADINKNNNCTLTYNDGKVTIVGHVKQIRYTLRNRISFYVQSVIRYNRLFNQLKKYLALTESNESPMDLFMNWQRKKCKENVTAMNAVIFGKFGLDEGLEHMKILRKWEIIMEKSFVSNKFDIMTINKSITFVFKNQRPLQQYQELLSHYDPSKKIFDFDPKPIYLQIDPAIEPPIRTEILPFRNDMLSLKLFLTHDDAKMLMHTKEGSDCLDKLRQSIKVDVTISDENDSKCGFINLKGSKHAVTRNKEILKEFLHGTEIFPLTSIQVYKQIVKALAKAKFVSYTENCADVYKKILTDEDCLRENPSSTELQNNLKHDFIKLHSLLFVKHKISYGPKHVTTLRHWKNNLIRNDNLLPKTVLDEIKNAYFYIFDEKRKGLDYNTLIQSINEYNSKDGNVVVPISEEAMRDRFRELKVLCFSNNLDDKMKELQQFEKFLSRMKYSMLSMQEAFAYLVDVEKDLRENSFL